MDAVFVRHVFSLVFSFLLALYIIPMMIKAAYRFNILDKPDNRIKNHKKAVPYLGGIGVFIPFIATLAIVYPFENEILWLLLGVTFLLFIGLVDDLKILKPFQKLFGQFIAVLCFLKGGFSLKAKFFSDFFRFFTSGFWMLSVINAFNLVDVMDGLASILAIIATVSFFVIAILLKQYSISILLLAFIGPLFVFFYYNKPKARIYLGDSGSLFIGGFLAAIPLLFPWSSKFDFAYYTPIIILGIPLLEVASLVVIRTCKKMPFYRGSPHHFIHYLKYKLWSVHKILLFTGIMSSFLSVIAILFLFKFVNLFSLLSLGCIFLVIWFYFVFW